MDSNDTFRLILDQLDCKSAINLCQSNPSWGRFCQTNLQPSLETNFAKQGLISKSLLSSKLTCQIQNHFYPTITGYDNILYYLVNNKIYKIDLPPEVNGDVFVSDDIVVPEDIIQIMVYQNDLYAINSHGSLWILNNNKFRLLRRPDNIVRLLRNNEFLFITANGNTYEADLYQRYKQELKYKGVIDVQGNFILKRNNIYLNNEVILNNIDSMSIGYNHRLALTFDHQVYCWGINDYGQLGLGNQKTQYTPTLIPGLDNIVQVLAAKEISLFLTSNGDVYHCGRNLEDIVIIPTKLDNINNVIELYNMKNYPGWDPRHLDIVQLGHQDNDYFNYQIARTTKNNLLVLIGELLYKINLF